MCRPNLYQTLSYAEAKEKKALSEIVKRRLRISQSDLDDVKNTRRYDKQLRC